MSSGARPSTFQLTGPGPLRLYSTNELLRMPAPTWLITPILPRGGLCGLYGSPGVGKSFLAIDMALSVASGRPWQGHETVHGPVLYIGAEGGTGIGKRVRAWLTHTEVTPSQARVAWLTESVSVYNDSTDVDTLMGRIESELREEPVLIVIDTLARCFDGDENQQQDMGRFISGVDRMRLEYGATLLVVHHTRLDGERERGNTAFRGAAETMIKLTKSGTIITMECNKQKDAEEFARETYCLIPVPSSDSCVIGIVPTLTHKNDARVGELFHILRTQGPLMWNAWFEIARGTGWSKSAFHRSVRRLEENGKIIKEKNKWRVSTASEMDD